jgi:hypothetical protein
LHLDKGYEYARLHRRWDLDWGDEYPSGFRKPWNLDKGYEYGPAGQFVPGFFTETFVLSFSNLKRGFGRTHVLERRGFPSLATWIRGTSIAPAFFTQKPDKPRSPRSSTMSPP